MKSVVISEISSPYYKLFRELYDKSFPVFEQRPEKQQCKVFGKENYKLIAFFDKKLL